MLRKSTVGSDHYPIYIVIEMESARDPNKGGERWKFEGANWDKFRILSEGNLSEINVNQSVNKLNKEICESIVEAAKRSIPRSRGNKKKKLVPWWMSECTEAVKARNKSFKVLKKILVRRVISK